MARIEPGERHVDGRSPQGLPFFAGVRDLCGWGPVSWSMGNRQTSGLITQAVTMAAPRREPGTELIRSAWSRPADRQTGDCYDNTAIERFWATLKRELSWINGSSTHELITPAQHPLRLHRHPLQPGALPSRARSLSPLDYEALLVVA